MRKPFYGYLVTGRERGFDRSERLRGLIEKERRKLCEERDIPVGSNQRGGVIEAWVGNAPVGIRQAPPHE